MTAFIASFIFVVLAEMGDKTQLLAMAFAARYSPVKVLIAVFLATMINHGLAVVAGRFLTTVVPLHVISLLAALSFIVFGLWTIRGDRLDGEEKKTNRFGPIATVAIAFFFAEMGDKTQLATVSLAVQYQNMFHVLLGTTLGMIVADAIGIFAGIVLRMHLPDRVIKWSSSVVFILFGFIGVYSILSKQVGVFYLIAVFFVLTFSTIYVAYRLARPVRGA